MNGEKVLFALLRQQLCGAQVEDGVKDALTPEMLQKLYKLAGIHDLGHMVGQALEELGALQSEPAASKFRQMIKLGVFRYVSLDHEYHQACQVLEAAQIPFIPLKGSVLRAHYPQPWMRSSCDIDILVKEEMLDQAEKVLQEKLQYTEVEKGDHDIALRSPGNILLELHYDTVQKRYADDYRRQVLGRIWQEAHAVQPGSFRYTMSDEMFYFYHMAHMAKHFETGGCGIRPFLDIWVMNHRMEPNREARERLLQEGRLLPFARAMEAVSESWLSNMPGDRLCAQVSAYILRGGVFGSHENRAAVGQAKTGGRLRYLITRRVFMPYEYLKAEYPVLNKHKFLLPVYQVVRWVRMLLSGALGKTLREVRSNAETSDHARAQAEEMLRDLGL